MSRPGEGTGGHPGPDAGARASAPADPADRPGAAGPTPGPASRRLFFALWPADAERRGLVAAVRDAVATADGRPVPPGNYHLTLAFLGSVPEARLGELREVAATVAARHRRPAGSPVQVPLDRLEWWRRPRVLVATGPEAAAAGLLARDLQSALAAAGFRPDLRPFRPHVTLARKVARAAAGAGTLSVHLSFGDFALVDSVVDERGSAYSVLASWALCGG